MEYKKPKLIFEKSGFVNPEISYYIPLENVTNMDKHDMKTMVDHGRYFSIFAPRQSGKTTFLHAFCKDLEQDSTYITISLSFEDFHDCNKLEFYKNIEEALFSQLENRLIEVKCHNLNEIKKYLNSYSLEDNRSFYMFFKKINSIIKQKKIVIFIDEFDGIPKHEISNFLTSLRKLYQEYKVNKNKALYSVGLIGIRNITKLTVSGVSPFNIADYIELPSFNYKNINDLYAQFTNETNKPFSTESVELIFQQTAGQPWLVNRLGSIITTDFNSETTIPFSKDDVEKAINTLILESNDHFYNLSEKMYLYKETFRKILFEKIKYNPEDRAQSFLKSYGLIKNNKTIANVYCPIYEKRFKMFFEQDNFSDATKMDKQIFISYSREDKKWLDSLITYLKTLENVGIKFWYDKKIQAGTRWLPEIQDAIENSQIAICLISNTFLGSKFIRKFEVEALLNRKKEGLIIIPILIEECAWKIVDWLKEIQMHPKQGIPMEDLSIKDQKKVFVAAINEIGQIYQY